MILVCIVYQHSWIADAKISMQKMEPTGAERKLLNKKDGFTIKSKQGKGYISPREMRDFFWHIREALLFISLVEVN